jgi:hypothetical protein
VPSSVDHEWATDVKKASLQLPPRIKKELRKFLSDPVKRSKRIYTYRGKQDSANSYWDIRENQANNRVSYHISAENDLLVSIFSGIDSTQRSRLIKYLGELAEHLPLNHIYQKMADSPRDIDQENVTDVLLEAIMNRVFEGNVNE